MNILKYATFFLARITDFLFRTVIKPVITSVFGLLVGTFVVIRLVSAVILFYYISLLGLEVVGKAIYAIYQNTHYNTPIKGYDILRFFGWSSVVLIGFHFSLAMFGGRKFFPKWFVTPITQFAWKSWERERYNKKLRSKQKLLTYQPTENLFENMRKNTTSS